MENVLFEITPETLLSSLAVAIFTYFVVNIWVKSYLDAKEIKKDEDSRYNLFVYSSAFVVAQILAFVGMFMAGVLISGATEPLMAFVTGLAGAILSIVGWEGRKAALIYIAGLGKE